MSRLLLKNALYVNRFNTSLLIKLFQDNQRIIQKCSECGVEVNYTVRFFEKTKFCRTCAMAKRANIPTLYSYITAENATIIGNNVECKCKKCGNIELSTKTRFRQKIQRWNKFLYTTSDNKIHTYTPDFIINKTDIIEIKGSHLFNENGALGMLGDERDLKKFELIKFNNITLIGQNKIKFYMDYINKNYGREYLNTFKKF